MPPTEDGLPFDKDAGATEAAPADRQRGEGRVQAIRESFRANYQTVQYHFVQFLAEHLTDCRKTLGGDFDDLMVLAVVGQRFLEARRAVDAGDEAAAERIWMTALRLSDVTGIPRESVRRKLFRLEARGWVTNDPDRGWRLAGTLDATQARTDLNDLDSRSQDRLARLMGNLMPLLAAEDENCDPPRTGTPQT